MRSAFALVIAAFLVILPGLQTQAAQVSPPGTDHSVAQNSTVCPGYMPSRLGVGIQARVTPGLPNAVRTQPGAGWNVGIIPGGGVFTVTGGPSCVSGIVWWLVNYNGLVGWTGEGQYGTYWLEPLAAVCTSMPTRLSVGMQARVTPGDPNTIRSQPGAGVAIGYIPGGGTFAVVGGPQCAGNMTWWQVNYNGQIGWTSEGQYGVYWLEPFAYNCSTLPTRLSVGRWGRVTPGLPNTLRSLPTVYSTRLGYIPGGGAFYVVSGPTCAGGINWWLVNYNGVVGWTGEGQYGTYWLEPY
jgi:hypothetical protein